MNSAVLLLIVLDFALIGLLPVIFFKRDGRLNAMWWLTAWPFVLCPLLLIGSWYRLVPRLVDPGPRVDEALAAIAVTLSAGSIALIAYTLGTHRSRIALWHQQNDAPTGIVTHGAYQRIRHPFYASFLLAFLGAAVFCPQPWVAALLVYSFAILNHTAAREERRLLASPFGGEYAAYVARTGRFAPRWRRPSA